MLVEFVTIIQLGSGPFCQAKPLVQTVLLTVTKLFIPHIKCPTDFILMGFQTRYRIIIHSHIHKHLAAATSALQWLYRAEPPWQLLTLFQTSADLTKRSYNRRWRRGSEADHLLRKP